MRGVDNSKLRCVTSQAVGGVVLASVALRKAGGAGGRARVVVVAHAVAEVGSRCRDDPFHGSIADCARVVGAGRALDTLHMAR